MVGGHLTRDSSPWEISGGISSLKGAQVLEREEGVESPSLEVSRAGLEVALGTNSGLGTGWGQAQLGLGDPGVLFQPQ